MTLSKAEVDQLKKAPPVDGVFPIFLNRWSPRSFDDREVSDADLAKVFEAARWTSSAMNEQPWRFLITRRGTESYQKLFDTVLPKGQSWVCNAPVMILLAVKTKFSYKDDTNSFAIYDAGGAATSLCLQAHQLGLSTRQAGCFEPEAARAAFGIPEDYRPFILITLGYQGEPGKLPDENYMTQEQSARKRKPLDEIVMDGAWGQSAQLG